MYKLIIISILFCQCHSADVFVIPPWRIIIVLIFTVGGSAAGNATRIGSVDGDRRGVVDIVCCSVNRLFIQHTRQPMPRFCRRGPISQYFIVLFIV